MEDTALRIIPAQRDTPRGHEGRGAAYQKQHGKDDDGFDKVGHRPFRPVCERGLVAVVRDSGGPYSAFLSGSVLQGMGSFMTMCTL